MRTCLGPLTFLLLAAGCINAREHFEDAAAATQAKADRCLSRRPPRIDDAIKVFSLFLARLPEHASLDGVRVQMLKERAKTLRMARRTEEAAADEGRARWIEENSPYFLRGPGAQGKRGEPASPGQAARGGGTAGGPEPTLRRPRSFLGRVWTALAGPDAEPSLEVSGGVHQWMDETIAAWSDSRQFGHRCIDFDEDLPAVTSSGAHGPARVGINSTTLGVSLLAGRRAPMRIGADFRYRIYRYYEDPADEEYTWGSHSFTVGEPVGARFEVFDNLFFMRFPLLGRSLDNAHLDWDLGLRYVHANAKVWGDTSGGVQDTWWVPMLTSGLRADVPLFLGICLRAHLRLGGLGWQTTAERIEAYNGDFDLSLTTNLEARLFLNAGINVTFVKFYQYKSGDRREGYIDANYGFYVELGFHFWPFERPVWLPAGREPAGDGPE